jgi:cell division protein FtsW (lipid II flippase)
MKNLWMRLLNYLLYLAFCLMAGTGLLLAYRLPPGSRGGRGLRFFDMDRHAWGDIHLWISFAFLALVVLHLVLNWKWLQKIAASRRVWMLMASLGLGLALIAFFLFAPVRSNSADKDERPRWGQRGR